ncbi:hypothetical protein D3C75_996400 [compost metagenome]
MIQTPIKSKMATSGSIRSTNWVMRIRLAMIIRGIPPIPAIPGSRTLKIRALVKTRNNPAKL